MSNCGEWAIIETAILNTWVTLGRTLCQSQTGDWFHIQASVHQCMLTVRPFLSVGRQVASRLSSVCMVCFNLFHSGIDMVGPVAELTDAMSTSNGLNIL
jgi:hypothetical protein